MLPRRMELEQAIVGLRLQCDDYGVYLCNAACFLYPACVLDPALLCPPCTR